VSAINPETLDLDDHDGRANGTAEARPTYAAPVHAKVTDPRPSVVAFVTTEHFVLQGARSSTIAESTARASMYLAAVSGGLVALGLVASAISVGTAFYAFCLVLLPTLAFIGLITFERVLQSGLEDLGYARRIALLRGYYFDNAPELAPYLLSVPPSDRLRVQGLPNERWQGLRTVAGMIGVITAVLTGSTASLVAIVVSDHSLAGALGAGTVVALIALLALMRFQHAAWKLAADRPLIVPEVGSDADPASRVLTAVSDEHHDGESGHA
jgi:hypothetical protein